MTHPTVYARTHPDKIAYQMAGTGKAITYRELDELSNQGAHLFRSLGLKAGDHIALLMENRLAFMEICWAAQRSGLYYTAISRYLTEEEIAYIVKDCGAKVFITTPQCADKVKSLIKGEPGEPLFFMVDEPAPGFRSWDKEAIAMPTTPVADEVAGHDMLYSSGSFSMRTNMVGTSCDWVILYFSTSFKNSSASKCSMMTEVPPSEIAIMLKRRGAA